MEGNLFLTELFNEFTEIVSRVISYQTFQQLKSTPFGLDEFWLKVNLIANSEVLTRSIKVQTKKHEILGFYGNKMLKIFSR